VKVAGRWVYLYRAVDQFGQVINVYASTRRNSAAARVFIHRAAAITGVTPAEVITDRHPRIRACSVRCSRRRGATRSSTPTTGSSPTTRS
jgi:transposase-like protein